MRRGSNDLCVTVAVVNAARSSHIAAMASPTNSPPSCNPPDVTGVARAQKVLFTGLPGVANAAVEKAARHTAIPPNDQSSSGRLPYLSVHSSAMTPPTTLGKPTTRVRRPGSSTPASLSTEEA